MQKPLAWRVPRYRDFLIFASVALNKLCKPMQYPASYFAGQPLLEVDCLSGALLMVRTSCMIKYGMYDEGMFLYGEEMVLGIKFKNYNLKSLLAMNQEYTHMHSVTISKSISTERHRRQLMLESFLYVLINYCGIKGFKLWAAKAVKWLAKYENALMYALRGYK